HVERAFDGDEEVVSTPFTLAHDLFAGVVGEQLDVGTDALAVAVISTLNNYFQIAAVLLLAVLFLEEFSSKSEILDGFNNATPIGNFARHVLFIQHSSSTKKKKSPELLLVPFCGYAKLVATMVPDNLYALPLEQQIGQFLFIGLPGTELDSETRALIEEVQPGGVIIFGRNVAGPEQLRSLLDGVRELIKTPPLFGIDQEGGLVDRLRRIFTPMPSARTIRQHGDLAAARALGRITGEVLRMLG